MHRPNPALPTLRQLVLHRPQAGRLVSSQATRQPAASPIFSPELRASNPRAALGQAWLSRWWPEQRRASIVCAAAPQAPVFPPSMTVSKAESYTLRLYEPFTALQVRTAL